jgi:hypothetical protein
MSKPVIKELPGLHGPVFSIYQDDDWWRDKVNKRRAWSTRYAAERAMTLTDIMKELKPKPKPTPKPTPKPQATKTISQLISEYEADNPNATAGDCAKHLGISVTRVFDRREP